MMKKYSVIFLFSIIFNANAFFNDNIRVKDPAFNDKFTIKSTKFTKWNASPTIIVLHGCDGARPHYQNWGSVINKWGYNAVFPDSFSTRTPNNICTYPLSISIEQRNLDVSAVAEWVSTQKWHKGKIGVIGFSHGGMTILRASNYPLTDKISAMVAYYPWCDFDLDTPKVPVQIHIGVNDDWTPISRCQYLKNAYDFHSYENTTHSFDIYAPPRRYKSSFGEQYLEYNPVSANQAEQRSKEFFKKYIGVEE
jgi:dienelactone hydrolase